MPTTPAAKCVTFSPLYSNELARWPSQLCVLYIYDGTLLHEMFRCKRQPPNKYIEMHYTLPLYIYMCTHVSILIHNLKYQLFMSVLYTQYTLYIRCISRLWHRMAGTAARPNRPEFNNSCVSCNRRNWWHHHGVSLARLRWCQCWRFRLELTI